MNLLILESFWTLLKVSGYSGKFTDTLENFVYTLESLRTLWNVSRTSGKLSDTLESFRNLWNSHPESFFSSKSAIWKDLEYQAH